MLEILLKRKPNLDPVHWKCTIVAKIKGPDIWFQILNYY